MPGINRTSVINAALRMIGASQINIQASSSSPANSMASAIFPEMLRSCLAMHPWSFAMRYTQLAQLSTTPLFGYAYSYQPPADCVRLIDMRTTPYDGSSITDFPTTIPKSNFENVGTGVYTDADPCYARYISIDCESSAHDPFIEALSARLAVELAPSLSSGGVSSEKVEQRYLYLLDVAKCFDMETQYPPRERPDTGSNFVKRRFSGIDYPEMH